MAEPLLSESEALSSSLSIPSLQKNEYSRGYFSPEPWSPDKSTASVSGLPGALLHPSNLCLSLQLPSPHLFFLPRCGWAGPWSWDPFPWTDGKSSQTISSALMWGCLWAEAEFLPFDTQSQAREQLSVDTRRQLCWPCRRAAQLTIQRTCFGASTVTELLCLQSLCGVLWLLPAKEQHGG
jgi:hypothetical protein